MAQAFILLLGWRLWWQGKIPNPQ